MNILVQLNYMHILGIQNISSETLQYAYSRYPKH